MSEGGIAKSEKAEQQREEYRKRGISLVAYELEINENPYFTNLDDDAFRSNRFMYILKKVRKHQYRDKSVLILISRRYFRMMI